MDSHNNASPSNSLQECSICIEPMKSKCFAIPCMHQFCFGCLLEWSEVQHFCPLCKQTFNSIIHNVTAMDNYEEYKVPTHVNSMNPLELREEILMTINVSSDEDSDIEYVGSVNVDVANVAGKSGTQQIIEIVDTDDQEIKTELDSDSDSDSNSDSDVVFVSEYYNCPTPPFESSKDESSSQEEYVCSSCRVGAKRTANNDGPCSVPRKKLRKRCEKRIYESSSSDNGDADGDGD